MKYSADQKLFFVHIPKCAGLSIYRGLDAIAEFPWASFARDNKEAEAALRDRVTPFGYTHAELGEIHQAHIPLAILARDFPETFALLEHSTSFAVLRDPRDRFISALRQHLREFDELLLAVGQCSCPSVAIGGHADELEQFFGASGFGSADRTQPELAHREVPQR